MDGWMGRQKEWMDKQVDGWMDQWMEGRMDFSTTDITLNVIDDWYLVQIGQIRETHQQENLTQSLPEM